MQAHEGIQNLVKKVQSKLSSKGGKNTQLKTFANAFLAQGVEDDLHRYSPASLAAITQTAFAFAAKRLHGRPKVEIHTLKDHSPAVSTIEILNDDMPFLVDSVLGLLNERNIEIDLVLHPILAVERGTDGKLKAVLGERSKSQQGVSRESFIHIHVRQLESEELAETLKAELLAVLTDVRTAVLDWRPMLESVRSVVTEFQTNPPPVPVDELAESIHFLEWMADGNFTLLGVREYQFAGGVSKGEFEAVKKTGLGILRDPSVHVLRRAGKLVSMTPELREFLAQPAPLIITKANVRATVHRRVHMDYIGVKRFGEDGSVIGEIRFIGLFTSGAYTRSPRFIPLLRRKLDYVVEQSGFNPEGHSGKALLSTLENYPRDDLFQIDPDTLLTISMGILQLEERPRTRVFVRRDKFDRFVSLLVYVPRDRYSTSVRMRIGDYLSVAFDGRQSAFYPAFPEGALARVHYIIGRNETPTPTPDHAQLEADVGAIVRTWDDHLADAVTAQYDAESATVVSNRYRDGFSAAYQDAFAPARAIGDIQHMEGLYEAGDLAIDFYRKDGDPGHQFGLTLYHVGTPIALSDRLPILESMGLRAINERSYEVSRSDKVSSKVWIHDIVLQTANQNDVALDDLKVLLKECFLAVWNGAAENDGFNALVIARSIAWRDVSVLRAVAKYLRQAAIPFSNIYIWSTLVRHSGIAAKLVELFHCRFDPATAKDRAAREKRINKAIEKALDDVASLNEDRVLRRFSNVINTALRTNFFQRNADGGFRAALAIKIRSKNIDDLPKPRPFAEIFVYAPDIEGIHLRGGAIARGGLRWSDRPEDFRTEVLGLVKAQQVKNAVIVPVGSKGGFVPKLLDMSAAREVIQEEAIRCYKVFITSLLDVTDNLKGEAVVPPLEVVRHDGDDPYLVVAADKGTATFSDIANGISEDRDFWLGDAFASGGSAGYDHKKMGITARGGWEAVKRHFREMERDIQSEPFTAVGCGDMSGDVFGNGMLLSTQTKLVAAFDHRDIFIDPDPNPAKSHAERQRMFNLARSTWRDYSAKLISKGGGIFSRADKSIALSPEIQALTGIKTKTTTPNDLIKALLKMPSDLLWFGGIGTYIRATTETDDQVGDRATDPLRITAPEVGAKVIGEGANLGLTQRARIEFAKHGGRVNTDAIDNSAGVNSSDVEVNIKIALGAAEAAGKLNRKARNKLLAEMTSEVASLVLRNNYQQTLSLTLTETISLDDMAYHARFMRELESRDLLDRAIEFLPDDLELAEREVAKDPLTRPELSVIMAYAKITLFGDLLKCSIPDDAYFDSELLGYFPTRLQSKYPKEIAGHRLRREIIATLLANSIINRGGPTFVSRLQDETGADVASIARAFAMARDCFGFRALNEEVDSLDNKVASGTQTALYLDLQETLRRQTVWFLRNGSMSAPLDKQIAHYHAGIQALSGVLDKVLPDAAQKRVAAAEKDLVAQKVPKALAGQVARLRYLSRGTDIVLVATQTKKSVPDVARAFYGIGVRLGIDRLAARAGDVEVTDYFDRLALGRSVESILGTQRSLVADILRSSKGKGDALSAWAKARPETLERTEKAMMEMIDSGDLTLAKVAVAGSYLLDLQDG